MCILLKVLSRPVCKNTIQPFGVHSPKMSQIDSFREQHMCFVPYIDEEILQSISATLNSINRPRKPSKRNVGVTTGSRSTSASSKAHSWRSFSRSNSARSVPVSLQVNLSTATISEGTLSRCNSNQSASMNSDCSVYLAKDRRRIIHPSFGSRFLDCLSECFWKCSAGCQEIPTDSH
ncbi:unnamed protein product [Acanthoscelides obtectus]|uniref:Uncharacterized protein n=1 Tax=Acanthoscelides obtectus TaxID=200917 RepID=A0A9P0P0K1_ACAOB|nr:unnamed protein product [Acanthoscelides obtectus]CAK1670041.1 hypothetical protein AOBTE_LOCUS27363 [Acanthoscelides obtectus]